MKKLILLFVLISVSFSSFGQTVVTDSVTNVVTDLQAEIYSDAKEAITVLAEKLGTTAEFIWPVLIKQQIIKASVKLIVIILILFIPLLAMLAGYGGKNWWKHSNDTWEGWYIASMVLGIIWIIITCLAASSIVTGLANPEYGAMKEIVHMIR